MTEDRGVSGWANKHNCIMKIRFHNLKPHSLSKATGTYSVRIEMDIANMPQNLDRLIASRKSHSNESPPHITSYMEFN